MPLRRRKITKEKIFLSDYLFRIAVVFLLVAILLAVMLWGFNEFTVSE